MDHLRPTKGRRRGLSINSITENQQHAMNSSIDNLQNDLSLIETQWNRILSEKTNPLELALAFLDDTSVGLGHRYKEFNQLKENIGNHLQEVVNEHSQVFNANVASYGKTVSSITETQENTSLVKKNFKLVNDNIIMQKGTLKELNEANMNYNNIINSLSFVEEVLQIPEIIEDHLRNDEYKDVQKLLERGFLLLNNHDLKNLKPLKPITQQLEMQEHVFFNNLIDEIHDIVYSKKNNHTDLDIDILKIVNINQNGFTSLESYLYNIANIDIVKHSSDINGKLIKFIKCIHKENGTTAATKKKKILASDDENEHETTNEKENITNNNVVLSTDRSQCSDYLRIFYLLSLIQDINKLPTACSILVDRARKEIHSIILKSTEKVRRTHPTLLKLAAGIPIDSNFGLSVNDLLSVIMRECFWNIFIKLLLAIQAHRAILESIKVLQPSTSMNLTYNINNIWNKLLDEVSTLLSRYLNNPSLLVTSNNYKNRLAPAVPKRKNELIFSLQNNIEDSTEAKNQAGELKALLKDIFPGFTVATNMDLETIYVKDESFEQEETLLPPSIFNLKFILEPFLLFSKASSNFISVNDDNINKNKINSTLITPMEFFENYMSKQFYPKIELTLNALFTMRVESNNPYALENIEENRNIFKAAADFQQLFYNILQAANTTNILRKKIMNAILDLLNKFYDYYAQLLSKLIGPTDIKVNRKIFNLWFNDEKLMNIERKILIDNDETVFVEESYELFKFIIEQFSKNGGGLTKEHIFNNITLETIIYFLNTIFWINSWLPGLKKVIDNTNNDDDKGESKKSDLGIDSIRNDWSFFETFNLNKSTTEEHLRILLDKEMGAKFDKAIDGFESLQLKLLSLLRFDIRARNIYQIGKLFQNIKLWNLSVGSTEVDQNITSLISELRMIENKLEQHLPANEKDRIFSGVDVTINNAFIIGAHSILVLNNNGVKKMLKNINVIQHTCRNIYSASSKMSMADSILYYTLCGADEKELFENIESGKLPFCSVSDLKTILRLQFSEELSKQAKRASTSSMKGSVKPLTKRYNDAMKKLDSLKK
ncbi:exocyst subunit SEC8 NDAI_0A05270 [Naumovozyma dairenensis CBS 421]|uniref:Exocyst complex component Sec8 n=1 Tax=Naumovozyma dairenensis (strain ATCC 10597 / BCRC 20456 / CBS 421 / NBRC 0211 / NRRL Y-12639) TaxID=1071378 RepID=G0W4E4_NAUDC|nr:hypothetical protein NDAI_0A05270 [Naumovozyma dairenensis CBS 421]CCD22682.1 hypothetical protein NDAI_0A05270 [Naumovozyma dairenensis CBS 421]